VLVVLIETHSLAPLTHVLPSKWLPLFRSLNSDMGVALAFDLR
jgi:hypothetical protein